MVVHWSKEAKLDLKNYYTNSKIYSKGKLDKYITDLVIYVNTLKSFPNLGKISYIHKKIKIRQLIFKMHKIFYYVQGNKVIIIQIAHTSRDLSKVIKIINNFLNKNLVALKLH